MKKVSVLLFLFLTASLLQTSCKKNNSDENQDLSGICYIISVGFVQIEYTTTHKPEYILGYDVGRYPMDTVIRYWYNSEGRISVVEYYPGQPPSEYDSILYDSIGRVEYSKYFLDGQHKATAYYQYNAASQLIEVGLSGSAIKKYSLKIPLTNATVTYEYDTRGNVRKEVVHSGSASGSIVESYEYEYDSKRNPFREWNLPEGFGTFNMSKLISKNNYVKEIYYDGYTDYTTTTVSYAYNLNGYPVKMVYADPSGSETYEAQYNCMN